MEEMYLALLGEAGCTKIESEEYETVSREGRWYIKISTTYNCGLTEVKLIPDVRRDLSESLETCLEVEDYERAAELRDILTDLNYDND